MTKLLPILAIAAAPFCVAALALADPATGPGLGASLNGPRLLPVQELARRNREQPVAAEVRAPVIAYDRPGGRALARLGTRTAFGSPRVLPVTGRDGPWLQVLSDMPDNRSTWIRRSDAAALHRRDVQLVADRSRRTITLVEDGRPVRRLAAGFGAAESPTPLGRFAVTDRLSGAPYGGAYGCCVLALSGHQRRLPAGWTGGDRLAIHATERPHPTEGGSAGCVVASDDSLRYLMRRVPLGTVVTIRR